MKQLNLQKQYEIAETFVGDLNRDFVHHCFLEFAKIKDVNYPDSYFYRIMISQLKKNSTFMKKYKPTKADFDITESELDNYDPQQVDKILKNLERRGLKEEVQVFRHLAVNGKICELERATGVRRDILKKIFNFVKTLILEKYVINHN